MLWSETAPNGTAPLCSFASSERSQNLCNQIHRASGKGAGFSGAGQSLAKEGLHNATRRALSQ
jgi:hypothetical protein